MTIWSGSQNNKGQQQTNNAPDYSHTKKYQKFVGRFWIARRIRTVFFRFTNEHRTLSHSCFCWMLACNTKRSFLVFGMRMCVNFRTLTVGAKKESVWLFIENLKFQIQVISIHDSNLGTNEWIFSSIFSFGHIDYDCAIFGGGGRDEQKEKKNEQFIWSCVLIHIVLLWDL